MLLKLTIYTDETLNEVKRVVEADKLKIPYRVSMYILQSLDSLEKDEDLVKFIGANVDKMDKIVKATFGVTDSELECVDSSELITMVKELFAWSADKVRAMGGNDSKN